MGTRGLFQTGGEIEPSPTMVLRVSGRKLQIFEAQNQPESINEVYHSMKMKQTPDDMVKNQKIDGILVGQFIADYCKLTALLTFFLLRSNEKRHLVRDSDCSAGARMLPEMFVDKAFEAVF